MKFTKNVTPPTGVDINMKKQVKKLFRNGRTATQQNIGIV